MALGKLGQVGGRRRRRSAWILAFLIACVVSVVGYSAAGAETQQATFSDAEPNAFFHSSNPLGGVIVAGHGVEVTVTDQNEGGTMTVSVVNPK